ncbi:hypothetical protein QCA50_010585 [Cerrena zonata]|uniref:Uncharacterized protein n=1 Tax=Cerrena zonata TaxID=2478898 RepID=A0AAW0FZD4_9APHY
MAATPTLAIASIKQSSLKPCVPHLMPFHIKHSGPAPVSTYFRPQECPPPSFGATAAVTSESQDTIVVSDSQEDTANASGSSLLTLNNDTPPTAITEGRHLLAAFRGRTVRGLEVALPEGYTGLILRTPSNNKPAPVRPSVPESNRRSGRRGRQAALEEDDDEEMNDDMEKEEQPQRVLTPAYSFEKLTIWHPDNAVDTSRDEYFRALSEWTTLGAVLHNYEE